VSDEIDFMVAALNWAKESVEEAIRCRTGILAKKTDGSVSAAEWEDCEKEIRNELKDAIKHLRAVRIFTKCDHW
jgi:phage gp29-like protein